MRKVSVFLLLLSLLPSPALTASMSAAQAASAEAEAFLSLLDRYHYTNAWRAGDAYFRARLSVKDWLKMLRFYRQP